MLQHWQMEAPVLRHGGTGVPQRLSALMSGGRLSAVALKSTAIRMPAISVFGQFGLFNTDAHFIRSAPCTDDEYRHFAIYLS